MYSRAELVRLAQTFCECTGIALSTLGTRATGNDKIFVNLVAGGDCRASAAERASLWFAAHWPKGLAWPDDVPQPRRAKPKSASGGQRLIGVSHAG
jgi:hypothetical protein